MAINLAPGAGVPTGSITATTISFTAPDTIGDSGSGFGFLSAGMYIEITGSASNDGTYEIATASATTLTLLGFGTETYSLVTEGAGASITIKEAAGTGLYELNYNNTLNSFMQPIVVVSGAAARDLRTGTGTQASFNADIISRDTILGASIDATEVTLEVDGKSIPSAASLTTIGSGFIGDDAGAESLADTLAVGNTTGTNNILVDADDYIRWGSEIHSLASGTDFWLWKGSPSIIGDHGWIQFTETTADFLYGTPGDSGVTAKIGLLELKADSSIGATLDSDSFNLITGRHLELAIDSKIRYTNGVINGDLVTAISANQSWTLPDATGTIALTSDIPASVGVTNGIQDISGDHGLGGTLVQHTDINGAVATVPTYNLSLTDVLTFSSTGTQLDMSKNDFSLVLTDTIIGPNPGVGLEYDDGVRDTMHIRLVDVAGDQVITMRNADSVTGDISTVGIGEDSINLSALSGGSGESGSITLNASVSQISTGLGGTLSIGEGTLNTSIEAYTPLVASVDATFGVKFLKAGATWERIPVADADKAMARTDFMVVYTSITIDRTVTLPTAASVTSGQVYVIKDESGSAGGAIEIIIDGNGAETVDGAANIQITAPYGVARVYSNGTNWFTV